MSVLTGLVVLFVAEVLTLVVVAERIGPLDAVALLLVVSAFGPALVRRSGIGGMRRAYRAVRRGQGADHAGADALLRLVGALLVCVPGFLTDLAGLALWIGPVRAVVRRRLVRRSARLLVDRFGGPGAAPWQGRGGGPAGSVVDAGSHGIGRVDDVGHGGGGQHGTGDGGWELPEAPPGAPRRRR